LTYPEAKAFILPLVRELTGGTKCIWDYQNAPKPSNPYISLRLSAERTTGTEVRRRKDGSGILDVVSQKEATLSVNAFGTGTIDKLNMLWTALQRPTIVDRCFAASIAFPRAEAPQDLTALLDGRSWEERANIDLYVTYGRSIEDEPGYITTVIVTGELGERDQTIHETDPAEVEVNITTKGVQ
jgi:hypothetical protein